MTGRSPERSAAIGLALALLLFAGGEAAADIYQCVGPDGKTVFTSDASVCPGAKPHVFRKQVQTVLDEANSRVLSQDPRPAGRRGSAAGPDGIERMWRSKRPAAEKELKQAEQKLAQMQAMVRSCNRGGEWYQTTESGIRQHIPCSTLHQELEDAQQKRDELVEYLATGLEDECRKAGCQPGWVR